MTIRVKVDPTNPGQFFACCGLLELADRLWRGAEGWFEHEGREFCVRGEGDFFELLSSLAKCGVEEVTRLQSGLEVKPLIAPLRLLFDGDKAKTLQLDSWMTIKIEKNKVTAVAQPPWNFWSGNQTSFKIWTALQIALLEQMKALDKVSLQDVFSRRVLLSGRFGFDPGAAWNALDVGFSPNEHAMEVASSALVELLAAIGLQRFRPQVSGDHAKFVYAIWGQPLFPVVAFAASSGIIQLPTTVRFLGRVQSRGSYAALGYSTPFQGDFDE